jgi:hypothetical protein
LGGARRRDVGVNVCERAELFVFVAAVYNKIVQVGSPSLLFGLLLLDRFLALSGIDIVDAMA